MCGGLSVGARVGMMAGGCCHATAPYKHSPLTPFVDDLMGLYTSAVQDWEVWPSSLLPPPLPPSCRLSCSPALL